MPREEKVPIILIEVYDRRDSGYVRDNTEGTKHEERLSGPSKLNIPNVSFRRRPDGKSNEKIRYIFGEDEISVEMQKKMGIEPNRIANTDKIVIENCSMSVAREGANIGLYDYITSTYYNATNPDRSDRATKLFNVVDVNKRQEEKNEIELVRHEAKSFVYTLQEKKGKEWVYQEERINALCELFQCYGELMSTKIELLSNQAAVDPKNFMNKVINFEQTISTHVAHALELNVIKFEGNTAIYIGKNKIIKNLGAGKIGRDQQIEQLAIYLRTKDGYEAMQELVAEVNHAKQIKSES